MSEIRAVIFDVDGTLVDSNDAHAHAWVAALAEHGHAISYEHIRALIGMGGDKLLPAGADIASESEEGRQISKRRGAIFAERFLPHLRAFPEVRALLEQLHAQGLKLAVASSAKDEELKPLLALTGAAELFETTTSSSDAKHSKPDPDIVQATLKRLDLPAAQVVMVGDTPYDIEAAARAGISLIALRCGGWDGSALGAAQAVYADPAELLAQLANSPLAQ
ncbi:hydrolase [Kouleothrix aurantiaca]|jgi:HAD superfamily hydrolase (TIGR01509 family)|uniref:Hydrolase n=1 Tax=Kouleothrix aurantiaca TaxID=186479 RepID=A0A0P9DJN8_9CHLR|nr:hydrolase [Kouleothrix aurantiaca]